MFSCKNNLMLTQAQAARFRPNWILQILLFLAVFYVSSIISSVIMVVPLLIGVFGDPQLLETIASGDTESAVSIATSLTMSIMEKPWIMLITLFATVITTLICIFYCCKIEMSMTALRPYAMPSRKAISRKLP